MDVRITKLNEVHAVIQAERNILAEIHDRFSFQIANAKFHPKVKFGIWDGYIRLFSLKNQTLYIGLIPDLCKFLVLSKYSFEIDPSLVSGTNFTLSDFEKMVEALETTITPHYYQKDAVIHILNEGRAAVLAPTSSGKSFIIYLTNAFYRAQGHKTLIVCSTKSLVKQMEGDLKSYSPYHPEIQIIMEGYTKEVSQDTEIVVATWQSITKLPQKWFNQFRVVIGDEIHLFTAKSLVDILEKCQRACWRFGFTGTIHDAKTNEMVLTGLFGPIYKVITTKELMDEGYIAKLKIKPFVFKYPKEICKTLSKLTYQDEFSFLISNEKRNEAIAKMALSLEENSLILFDRIETHGKLLYDIIRSKTNRPVYFLHGGIDVDDREAVREIMEKNTDVICLASSGIFSTGVNIRNLHHVFLTSLGKSKIKVLQSIGRSLRLHSSKEYASLYDFTDDLRGSRQKLNYALKHFEERMEVYQREQFEVLPVKVLEL
jgi:superfamily II DNA or RNA helicase